MFGYVDCSFGATVCKTVRPMLSDRCPVCSVCDVGVLWPNGWMGQYETWHGCRPRSMPQTGTHAAPHPRKRGTAPIFSPCPLWPKSWMDKDATWYESRPRPRSHCVRLGPSPSPHKKGAKLQFLAHVLWPNGWIDQDANQCGGRPRPRPRPHIVLDGDPPPPFKVAQPIFGPCLLWPNGWMDQDATW